MAQSPILLLDDGELDDIQGVLEQLGTPFARVRGARSLRIRLRPRNC